MDKLFGLIMDDHTPRKGQHKPRSMPNCHPLEKVALSIQKLKSQNKALNSGKSSVFGLGDTVNLKQRSFQKELENGKDSDVLWLAIHKKLKDRLENSDFQRLCGVEKWIDLDAVLEDICGRKDTSLLVDFLLDVISLFRKKIYE